MNCIEPIGIFDSGLGGISVLNKCIEFLPNEDYIYFADKKNAPYGDKKDEDIVNLLIDVVENVFLPRNVKAIVIACNTATNAAIDILRNKYDITIIGTEPAIKPAITSCSEGNKTLIMATESTINSKRFKNKLMDFDSNKYIPLGCSGLVELIESGKPKEIEEYLKNKFKDFSFNDIESIVLGCTHYPFVKECIENVVKKDIAFFDGGEGVAKRLKSVLEDKDIICRARKIGTVDLLNSEDESYNNVLSKYIRRW